MAYSAGFTPHPKVSYANAAPTGTGSEAEYLEIALTEHRDPDKLRLLLDESLPGRTRHHRRRRGPHVRARRPAHRLRVGAAARRGGRRGRSSRPYPPSSAPRPSRSSARRRTACGPSTPALPWRTCRRSRAGRQARIHRAADAALINRPGDGPCAILRLVVRHVTPAVRPDDVLSGLRAVADLAPPVPAAVTRLAQGLFDEESGTVTDPLAPDREAVPAAPPTAAGTAAATAPEGPVRVRAVVVAQPWYSGATWVGPRTDQKTFARPYVHRVRNRRAIHQLPCGARAPDGGTAHITRAVAGPESGVAPGSVTGEPPACSSRTNPVPPGTTKRREQHPQRHAAAAPQAPRRVASRGSADRCGVHARVRGDRGRHRRRWRDRRRIAADRRGR